jgi:hypothetical protein
LYETEFSEFENGQNDIDLKGKLSALLCPDLKVGAMCFFKPVETGSRQVYLIVGFSGWVQVRGLATE